MVMVVFDPSDLADQAQSLVPPDSPLFTTGVPDKLGDAYAATEELGLVQRRGGPFVRFGMSGHLYLICLDPSTGEVIRVLLYSDAPPTPVNASLEMFVQCVQAANDGAGREELRAIDETTAERAGFWAEVFA
jgi:hypothetical protein